MPPIALTIAGSDPSGGAGIQADLKTFHQFGVYGEAVVTLLTVQNTVRLSRVEVLAPGLVLEQLDAVLEDMPPGAAKTGALGSLEVVEAIARAAARFRFPLVIDPVMIGKHGHPLLSDAATRAVRDQLMPLARLITPNVPEAEALSGIAILSRDDMRRAAARLHELGARAVLIKGGHAAGDAIDLLSDDAGSANFRRRGSIRATPTAPAAPTRLPLPPVWLSACRSATPWPRPNSSFMKPSGLLPNWAAAPDRSTIMRRCYEVSRPVDRRHRPFGDPPAL
jgi:hydroxymethylpyrimidine/phosphomethylpyrimidine kinase